MTKLKNKHFICSGALVFIFILSIGSFIIQDSSRPINFSQELLEFLHPSSSGTIVLDDDEHYSSYLGYLSYRAYVFWNFSSSDPDVNIAVKAMTQKSYEDYIDIAKTGGYSYYSLSSGKNSDKGYYYPRRGEIFYIVFENSHSYKSTTLTWETIVLYPTGIFSGNNPAIITIIFISVVGGILAVTVILSGIQTNKFKREDRAAHSEF